MHAAGRLARQGAWCSQERTDGSSDAAVHHPAPDHRLHVLHADHRVSAAGARRAQGHGLHAAAGHGPYLVGSHGLLQPFADILKLLFKEELPPKDADKLLFTLAPVMSVMAAFAAFATVPWCVDHYFLVGLLGRPVNPLGVADVNVAVLVVFAVTSMGVYGIVLAGWSSNSKYWLLPATVITVAGLEGDPHALLARLRDARAGLVAAGARRLARHAPRARARGDARRRRLHGRRPALHDRAGGGGEHALARRRRARAAPRAVRRAAAARRGARERLAGRGARRRPSGWSTRSRRAARPSCGAASPARWPRRR